MKDITELVELLATARDQLRENSILMKAQAARIVELEDDCNERLQSVWQQVRARDVCIAELGGVLRNASDALHEASHELPDGPVWEQIERAWVNCERYLEAMKPPQEET